MNELEKLLNSKGAAANVLDLIRATARDSKALTSFTIEFQDENGERAPATIVVALGTDTGDFLKSMLETVFALPPQQEKSN